MLFLFIAFNTILIAWYLGMLASAIRHINQSPAQVVREGLAKFDESDMPREAQAALPFFAVALSTLFTVFVIAEALAFVPMPFLAPVASLLGTEIVSNFWSYAVYKRAFTERRPELLDTWVNMARRGLGLVCDSICVGVLAYAIWAIAHVHG